IDDISGEVVAAAGVVVDAPRLLAWLEIQIGDPDARALWLEVALKLGIIFGFALFGEWSFRTLLQRPRRSLNGETVESFAVRIFLLLARVFLDAMPVLAFAGIAYLVLALSGTRFATERVATTLVSAYVTARIIVAVAHLILLPRRSMPILNLLADETRSYLFIWVRRFTYTFVWGFSIAPGAWWLAVPAPIHPPLPT